MSFINNRNNKGAKTVPCGTPERTSEEMLCLLSRITLCERLLMCGHAHVAIRHSASAWECRSRCVAARFAGIHYQ